VDGPLRGIVEKEEGANRELASGFLSRGFLTDIVIAMGNARAHGVLFEVGAPLNPRFQPTIRGSLTTSQVLRRPPGVT
jgi:hypothetical protein